jgi:hypothetical protein
MTAPDEAKVFTVRLWRQQGAFRAAVRLAGDEVAELIETPQALSAYFERQAFEPGSRASRCPPGERPDE